jgi:hypothetical protein
LCAGHGCPRGASVRVGAEVAAQARRWWWNAWQRVRLILRNFRLRDDERTKKAKARRDRA